jgi:hypothetical protein
MKGFWQGFAQAYKDADAKKTEDRRILEERQFREKEISSDRKWQEDFFFRKLAAETEAERRNALLTRSGGSGRGAGGSSGGNGGGGSQEGGITLETLVRAHPELDPEVVAQLAPYPDAIAATYEELTRKKKEYADNRQAWSPELSNNFVRDVVPYDDEEITPERVADIAQMYGVDPSAEVYAGSGTTWADVIADQEMGGRSATVLFDPNAAPEPMKAEDERLYRETAGGRMKGYLTTQLQQLNAEFATKTDPTRRDVAVTEEDAAAMRDEIAAVEDLISQVDEGYVDEALSSEYGTKAMQDLWNSGDRTDYRQMFPSFTPHFASPEEAKAALASGFVNPGQKLMVYVEEKDPQGNPIRVLKQARF